MPQFNLTRDAIPKMPRVVVVGGGLAGLSATVEALRAGAHVTVIDKGRLGGNSARATSGINGAVSKRQFAAGVLDDSIALFVEDIVKSGQGQTDVSLAYSLAARSAKAVEFLEEILGKELTNVGILGGHSKPRTHRLPVSPGSKLAPIGFLTISALKAFLADPQWKDRLQILENTNVTGITLATKDGSDSMQHEWVTSVTVEPSSSTAGNVDRHPYNIDSEAVVLSSGGFSANPTLVKEMSALAGECPFTTNGPFATGDLLSIGRKLHFDTVGIDLIQLHPTGFVDPKNPLQREKFLCPEMFRGCGALIFNKDGRRFINELERRDVVSQGIYRDGSTATQWNLSTDVSEQQPKMALLLMNDAIRQCVGPASFDFYASRGFIRSFESLEEAARELDMPLDVVRAELGKSFGENEPAGNEFDSDGRIFTAFVTPAVHYTMGGLKINPEAQVMRQGKAVPNLFAAGEVSGGLHGANRLGGNGMLESVVFGRLAGSNAARIAGPETNSDPFNAHPVIQMSVREVKPLDAKPGSVSLTLTYHSLGQYSPVGSGMKFRLSHKPEGSDDGQMGSIEPDSVESSLGSLSFVLPPEEHAVAFKALHPGSTVTVERLQL